MKKSTIIIILFGLSCLLLVGFIVRQYFDLADLKKAMADRTSERDVASKVLKTREDETRNMQQRVKNLNNKITQAEESLANLKAPKDQVNTEKMEGELDHWIDIIDQLKGFLKQHPEYGIPDMKFLTLADWLAVTKNAQLQSEADYRKAMAELRLKAKLQTLSMLSQGVADFSKANGGKPPQSLENITPYLPQDLDSDILQRFADNPSGQMFGDTSGSSKSNWTITEMGPPVDDIWDSAIAVNDRGGTTVQSIPAADENVVRNAMAKYQNEHGAMPQSFDQITNYIDANKTNAAKATQIFKSIMTPIQ